jgi:uncharacterized protein YndB with AHSA1/START domain
MAASAKASSALTVTLPSDREVLLTRVFDAPRELVFEALTNPEHLRHWFGRRGWTLAECEVDLKVGGAWRYVLRGPNGRSLGMRGVYKQIHRPERLVSTEAFDGFPHESLVTTTLTEEGGRTTLNSRVICASKEVRDGVINSGMEGGAAETYDRLAQHLAAMPRAEEAGPELVVTRLFDASRDLVFECWTTPEHLRHWQGAPRGFTVTSSESDIRPGGFFRICMRSPDGMDHWLEGHYREIAKPERLVFTHVWLDASRKPGKETLVAITFAERDGSTELILRQTGFPSLESRDGHKFGWSSALDVLVDYLTGVQARRGEFTVATRVFDAPRKVVFRAWTDRDQLQRWWGPKGFTNPVCEVDVRPGGAIRIDMRAPDGVVYPMTGTFVEIAEPERLVFISAALDQNGEPLFEVLNTVTFEEDAGKTKLTVRASVSKIKPGAARYLAGMEPGWSQSLDRLRDRLAELVNA